jgi:alpha-L-fucosidase
MIQLPTPSPRQLAWHQLETYAFVHFGPNTFTGEEWGHGNEDPGVFNPTKLDCQQWAKTFKAGGMKGVIITAKHHDGFALWPSKFSTHTVAQSKWRDGKGDVLRELSQACRAEGLKFGVYLSPWDRNHPSYGTPEYNQVFASMLKEVLTGYGLVFEVWFDGANGEGPNGKKQVYDWPLFVKTVRECQPNAVIFSDGGPDIRWVGNEQGYAGETNWATLEEGIEPGTSRSGELTEGHIDGSLWLPAECDVSIRPGWFWRASEDSKVKTVDQLMDIYYGSVGRGGSLLLNVPPNSDGLISDVDARRLVEFREARERAFARPVNAKQVQHALLFEHPSPIGMVVLREQIEHGQRIRRFHVEAETPSGWKEVARGTTIGPKRILRFEPIEATGLRLVIEAAKAEPLIKEIAAYEPNP